MAEFCEACAAELGHPYGDFRDIAADGEVTLVLCEGCGPTYVDHNGNCVSKDCLKAGKPGHGMVYNNGPEYEDGPWAEGWEDRSKGGGIDE